MNFQAAYGYLKNGQAISLPEWEGYWLWDDEEETIAIVTDKGEAWDIRSTQDLDFTIQFMFRTDWEVVELNEEDEDEDFDTESDPEVCGCLVPGYMVLALLHGVSLPELLDDLEEELDPIEF